VAITSIDIYLVGSYIGLSTNLDRTVEDNRGNDSISKASNSNNRDRLDLYRPRARGPRRKSPTTRGTVVSIRYYTIKVSAPLI
jgi:hypothetical protein